MGDGAGTAPPARLNYDLACLRFRPLSDRRARGGARAAQSGTEGRSTARAKRAPTEPPPERADARPRSRNGGCSRVSVPSEARLVRERSESVEAVRCRGSAGNNGRDLSGGCSCAEGGPETDAPPVRCFADVRAAKMAGHSGECGRAEDRTGVARGTSCFFALCGS